MVKVNEIINGKNGQYQIISNLGSGPLGTSWLVQALQANQAQQLLLKTVNIDSLIGLNIDINVLIEELEQLIIFSKTVKNVERYMVKYYDYIQYGRELLVISDYITGTLLSDIIKAQIAKNIEFDTQTLLNLMINISKCVDFIHSHGLAHQNIKPSNIIRDQNTGKLKLLEFSQSCMAQINAACRGKVTTVYYTPPELLKESNVSQLSFDMRKKHDVWSLGVVFYQLANLNKHYININSSSASSPDTIANVIKDIAIPVNASNYSYQPINDIIRDMLNKNPADRINIDMVLKRLNMIRVPCTIDGKDYPRDTIKSILFNMNIPFDQDIDDIKLCGLLSNELAVCKIKEKNYNKPELRILAEQLNINTHGVTTVNLCEIINNELQKNIAEKSKFITEKLLQALKYINKLQLYHTNNNSSQGLIFKELNNNYNQLYEMAVELDLINKNLVNEHLEMLKARIHDYPDNIEYPKYLELIQAGLVPTF